MKIISKFTDFYDYKVSEYGIDEKLVYDRRKSLPPTPEIRFPKSFKEEDTAILAELLIGNHLVNLFVTPHKIYTQFDLVSVEGFYEDIFTFSDGKAYKCATWRNYKSDRGKIKSFYEEIRLDFNGQTHQVIDRKSGYFQENFEYNGSGRWAMFPDGLAQEPIMIRYAVRENDEIKVWKFINPCLMNMGIFLDADFVWQSLVEFLSKLKSDCEISPEVPNDEVITNKGFDKKTSFRPKMKK